MSAEAGTVDCIEQLTPAKLLLYAFCFEGGLAVVFLIWNYWTAPAVGWDFNIPVAALGAAAAIPIWTVNWLLVTYLRRTSGDPAARLPSTRWYLQQIVIPFSKSCPPGTALGVSLLAGIGEEFFFRGLVQHLLGWVAASVLFSVVHFGTAVTTYRFLTLLYAVVGAYLGWLYLAFGNIWIPVIAHAVYDFGVLLYFRKWPYLNSAQ